MQDKNHSFIEFSERTEALALALRKNISELPDFIGISPSMLHSYRSGKLPISAKAWRKLEAAESKNEDTSKIIRSAKSETTREPDPVYPPYTKPPTIEDRLARLEAGMEAILRILSEDRNPKPEPLPKPGKPLTYPKGSE